MSDPVYLLVLVLGGISCLAGVLAHLLKLSRRYGKKRHYVPHG